MDLIIKIFQHKITKILLFLALIALILSVYFFRAWYSVQYHKALGFYYVYKADRAYKQQKYQKAIDLYKAALSNYPGHSRASCNLGNIYVSFENYSEAVKYYENALKYTPDFVVCRMNLGIILSEKTADYDKAAEEYELAAQSKPFAVNIPFVYNSLETLKINRGTSYYNAGLAYTSKSMSAGRDTIMHKKYLKKAEEAFLNAQKFLKDNFDNTYNLALILQLSGNYDKAAEEYCKAVNLKPDNFDAHYNFAVLLLKMHKYQEALEELEKSLLLADYSSGAKHNYLLSLITDTKKHIAGSGGRNYLNTHQAVTSLGKNDIVYSNGRIKADNQPDLDIPKLMKCTYGKKDNKADEKQ